MTDLPEPGRASVDLNVVLPPELAQRLLQGADTTGIDIKERNTGTRLPLWFVLDRARQVDEDIWEAIYKHLIIEVGLHVKDVLDIE
jgi:hypothetical protein